MRDDVYLGGVAVSAYLTPITLMKGFYAPPPPTGQDYILPGYPGARPAELGQGVLTVTVGGTIVGSTDPCNPRVIPTRDQYIAKLMAFKSIAYQNNRPFTIGFTSGGFSVPMHVEDYVHRIGRTGRAQAVGDAISFVTPADQKELKSLERFIGRGIVRKRAEGFDYNAAPPPPAENRGGLQQQHRRGGEEGGRPEQRRSQQRRWGRRR